MVIRASYQETEPRRIVRLTRVAGMSAGTDTYNKILVLDDHKGRLGVLWSEYPTAIDKYRVESAWELECECIENIVHRFANRGETDIFD